MSYEYKPIRSKYKPDTAYGICGSIIGKRCTKCGDFKELEQFHKQKNGKHGRKAYCKLCSMIMYYCNHEYNKKRLRDNARNQPEHIKKERNNRALIYIRNKRLYENNISTNGVKKNGKDGYVYFIGVDDNIKIGFTHNYRKRFKEANTWLPNGMEKYLIIKVKDPHFVERELHILHKKNRVRESCEWFKIEINEIMESISDIKYNIVVNKWD